MRRLASASLVLLLAAVVAAPAAIAGWGMPDALTPRGQLVGGLYDMIAVMGIAMFVLVFVWLVVVIWRYREGSGHGKATHEKSRHSLKAEVTWVVIPLLLVGWIGFSAYGDLVQLDRGIPLDQVQLEVKVEGTQWNWQFDYGHGVKLLANPDLHTGNVSAENTFLVPQDTNLLLNITSGDVIHAFDLRDANRAFVMFLDANPLGANKHNLQTVNLPAGDYKIQCNKMCLNPGHAYMRGAIKAVPKPVFDHWLAEKAASAGASLVQTLPIQIVNGLPVDLASKRLDNQTLAVTTRLVLDVRGPHGDLSFDVGDQHRVLPAGETVNTFATFDFPTAGAYTLKVSDKEGDKTTISSVGLTVVPAEVKRVDMKNFFFDPKELTFEVGKTYLIQARNAGDSAHDMNIGHWNGGSSPMILAHSALVGPGGVSSFLFKPTEKGQFDLWCNPHATLGMLHPNGVTVA
ncbi:MAG: cytochrome c oxidase subunit [Thermoplasmata archaeon]|jgi:cytochrome c oxidase subunit 2|nr:cytochrome c oxidase subunit [Thermoplasmata archaeon]